MTSAYLNQPRCSEAEAREAQAITNHIGALMKAAADKAEAERAARRLAGEPDELWVNAFWDRKSARMEMFTHETETSTFEEIIEGIRDCDYRYTMKVQQTNNRYIRDVSAFDMEDDARAWRAEG